MQGPLRLFIEASGVWETSRFPPAEEGLSSEMGASWKPRPSQSQVFDSRPKVPPAASTEQYADPEDILKSRLETGKFRNMVISREQFTFRHGVQQAATGSSQGVGQRSATGRRTRQRANHKQL
ncbi:unnamed protein product [Pleuronectes platessa]|uniref:Uncharacterized protein n=1 Tax=Pleuronectes platessa TaxID=8262 RepID=A0A9N7W1T5_PLEPL|nr:unnamed protein product [Pleuronectes platessa]